MNISSFKLILILLFYFILLTKRKNILCGNIAHGCGLLNKTKYTNSLEAFHNSYKKGYRKIEIDLLVTEDKHIVGAHDWYLFKKLINNRNIEHLNFTYLFKAKILNKYHVIYDYMIDKLLHKYKDVIIVTDRITNYRILKYYVKYTKRLYVEVPSFEDYILSKKIGFSNVMLNIQKKKDLNAIFTLLLNKIFIFGIVIGPNIFYSCKSQLLKLFKMKIHIYVWGINNNTDIKTSFCVYVSGFYID